MNQQQKTDYQTWKNNPEQPLPESLKNVFLEALLSVLQSSDHARNRYNSAKTGGFIRLSNSGKLMIDFDLYSNYPLEAIQDQKIFILVILTLLSRPHGGQAVMPFLDMEIRKDCILQDFTVNELQPNEENVIDLNACFRGDTIFKRITLRQELKDQFMDALTEEGKNLKQALEIITKTYLLNINE